MKEQTTQLIFTFWEGVNGVFFESSSWFRLSKTDNALSNAKTWGEFRLLLPDGEFENLIEWRSISGEQIYWDGEKYLFIEPEEVDAYLKEIEGDEDFFIIRASDKFEAGSINGYLDGDYPPWINNMFDDFPEEFKEKFGEKVSNMINGSWWEYPMADYDEMKAYLSQHGFSAARNRSIESDSL